MMDTAVVVKEIVDRWELGQEANTCAHQTFPEIVDVPALGSLSAELTTGIQRAFYGNGTPAQRLNAVEHLLVIAMAAAYAVGAAKTAENSTPF